MTVISWSVAFVAGAALGCFFFGSFWITVRQLPTTGWPIRLIIGSYFGRMAIAFLGFYLIMQGDWQRAVAGLLGFLIARFVIVRGLQAHHREISKPAG